MRINSQKQSLLWVLGYLLLIKRQHLDTSSLVACSEYKFATRVQRYVTRILNIDLSQLHSGD